MSFFRSLFFSLVLGLSGFFSGSVWAGCTDSASTCSSPLGGVEFSPDGTWVCTKAAGSVTPVQRTITYNGSQLVVDLPRVASCDGGANSGYRLYIGYGASCPSGQVKDANGVCVNLCPLPGVTAWNTNDSEAVETDAGQSVGTICDSAGCGIEPMGTEMVLPSGGGKEMHFIQWARYTGERPSTCNSSWDPPSGDVTDYTPAADTPDGVPNSQEDCPAGSAFGQVNGVNVCAPAGSKINYVPESGTSSGGGSSETTRTDTVNEDGSVTTTTTNVNNGSTTTTTNVTNNYGGASFGAGGTGSDATSINLGPAPLAEAGDVTVDLPGPGSGVDGAGTAQRDFTVSGHFSGAGGCIADRTISAMGVDVVIPLSELCPWFDVVSKILTIVSVFLAMRILVMS